MKLHERWMKYKNSYTKDEATQKMNVIEDDLPEINKIQMRYKMRYEK